MVDKGLLKFVMWTQVVSGDKSSYFNQPCREYFPLGIWSKYNFSLKKHNYYSNNSTLFGEIMGMFVCFFSHSYQMVLICYM